MNDENDEELMDRLRRHAQATENRPMRTDSNWIETYTGRRFWPTDPRPEDVYIDDIAHALSMTCRFTGHCTEFYSVAQHCVQGSRECRTPLWFLLHDATEAYLPDVARPLKREWPWFKEIEDNLMRVIAAKFDLTRPQPDDVKIVDARMLATERRDLMANTESEWIDIERVEPYGWRIHPLSPALAEEIFLERFYNLRSRSQWE